MTGEPTLVRTRQGSARDFLAVLFRRRWIIATVFLVTTLTVVAINLSQPLYYESTGKVIVKRGVKDNLIQGYMRTLTWEEELASEVETIKSSLILQAAQTILDERNQAAGEPTFRLDPKRVDAGVVGESNVIAISYQDRNPTRTQEATDAVIQAYVDHRKNAYTLQYPAEFFDSEIARVSAELDQWSRRREAYMQATGTVNLQVEGQNDAGFVREQQSALAHIDQNLAQARAALAGMRSYLRQGGVASDAPFATSSQQFGSDVVITEIKKKLTEARARLGEVRQVYVSGAAEVQQAEAQVQDLEAMLAREVGTRIRVAEQEIAALEARRGAAAGAIAEGEGRLSTFAERDRQLFEYDTKIAALKNNYEELTDAAAKAKIAKATSPDWTVALLTPAGSPYAKNQRDYVRLALAPIFSLIVGLGLAFFIDGLDATIKNPREAEEALELPVLASLTDQKRRRA